MYRGERFNSISHLVGAVLALGGGTILMIRGAWSGNPWKIVSFTIYSVTAVLLYLASTIYHSTRGKAKAVWNKLDYCAIYLLIAGSYTPFTLVSLRHSWGWLIFSLIWALAVLGIIQETCMSRGRRALSIIIYLSMGWLIILAVVPLITIIGTTGFSWLLASGMLYTAGLLFYAKDTVWRHAHGVWHLFVIGGSMCHYVAVLGYVS